MAARFSRRTSSPKASGNPPDGLTWTAARNGIPPTLNSPFQATVLSSVTSTASAVFATGIATGIYRSTDGGANWTYVGNGLGGAGARDIVALTNGTLFARVNENSLFRSTDNGDSWVNVAASLNQGNITSVATDGTRVFAFASTQKLLESTDGGNSFSIVDGGTPPRCGLPTGGTSRSTRTRRCTLPTPSSGGSILPLRRAWQSYRPSSHSLLEKA